MTLSKTHPEHASHWHPTKNGELTPQDVTRGSSKKIWWQCPADVTHVWQSSVLQKVHSKTNGCPYCCGRKICATNNLAYLFPHIAKQWHQVKNGKLTPDQVAPFANDKAWWQCSKESAHAWQAKISVVAAKNRVGCPFCKGISINETNSLATHFPEVAKLWHSSKNGTLTPHDVSPHSGKLVWWQCLTESSHEWQTRIGKLTRYCGGGCPFCSGNRVSLSTSLAARNPKLAAEWHVSENGDLTPADVMPSSQKRVWWQCPKNPKHVYNSTLHARSKGKGCPYCKNRKIQADLNSLSATHPKIAQQWHETLNGELLPSNVVAGSSRVVWWQCSLILEHTWKAAIESRTLVGTECPFCSHHKVCSTNSLATLNPKLAKEWHPTKNLESGFTPETVTSRSPKKVWWQCKAHESHAWITSVSARALGTGCPYCHGHLPWKEHNLAYNHPLVAQQWHPTLNGDLTPYDVMPFSRKKVWWLCLEGHVWKASVQSVVYSRQDSLTTGCPGCYIIERDKQLALTAKSKSRADRKKWLRERFL